MYKIARNLVSPFSWLLFLKLVGAGLAFAAPVLDSVVLDNTTTPPTVTIMGQGLCAPKTCNKTPQVSINGAAQTLVAGYSTTQLQVKWTPPAQGAYSVLVKNTSGKSQSLVVAGTQAHHIGDSYAGGIVFYVSPDGQHGLIAAKSDQQGGNSITWYNGINRVTGAFSDGLGAGSQNSAIIVATQIGDNPSGNFSAMAATLYSVQEDGVTACTGAATETCYGDWYMPSKYELNLLYEQQAVVGGFAGGNYYSSTEAIGYPDGAWGQRFLNGDQDIWTKSSGTKLRSIRSF